MHSHKNLCAKRASFSIARVATVGVLALVTSAAMAQGPRQISIRPIVSSPQYRDTSNPYGGTVKWQYQGPIAGALNQDFVLVDGVVNQNAPLGDITYSMDGFNNPQTYTITLTRTFSLSLLYNGVQTAAQTVSQAVTFTKTAGGNFSGTMSATFPAVTPPLIFQIAGGTVSVRPNGGGSSLGAGDVDEAQFQGTYLYTANASAVAAPEPAGLVLLSLPLAGVVLRKKRR